MSGEVWAQTWGLGLPSDPPCAEGQVCAGGGPASPPARGGRVAGPICWAGSLSRALPWEQA